MSQHVAPVPTRGDVLNGGGTLARTLNRHSHSDPLNRAPSIGRSVARRQQFGSSVIPGHPHLLRKNLFSKLRTAFDQGLPSCRSDGAPVILASRPSRHHRPGCGPRCWQSSTSPPARRPPHAPPQRKSCFSFLRPRPPGSNSACHHRR